MTCRQLSLDLDEVGEPVRAKSAKRQPAVLLPCPPPEPVSDVPRKFLILTARDAPRVSNRARKGDDDDDDGGWPDVAEEPVGTCCGRPSSWAADWLGKTCGGLDVVGAWRCDACGRSHMGAETSSEERRKSATEAWTIAHGGHSLDTPAGRLRIEGGAAADRAGLIARIANVPALERQEKKTRAKLTGRVWMLSASGRSVDTGACRLRIEGSGADVPAVLRRIARLPMLEAMAAR